MIFIYSSTTEIQPIKGTMSQSLQFNNSSKSQDEQPYTCEDFT